MKDNDTKTVLEDIAKIIHDYSDKTLLKRSNGDVLSYIAVRLAVLKAALLDTRVDAQSEMLRLEVAMETAKGKAYAKFKASDGATAAGDMKNQDEDYIAAKNAYNQAKVNYEKLKNIIQDAHDLIDSIKGRVIELGSSRKDER